MPEIHKVSSVLVHLFRRSLIYQKYGQMGRVSTLKNFDCREIKTCAVSLST